MITQFALRLVCGMSLMWCCMPRREVTSGFFRIQMLVTLGLSVLAALAMPQFSSPDGAIGSRLTGVPLVLSGMVAAASFGGSVLWTLERRWGGSAAGFLIAGLSAIGAVVVGQLEGQFAAASVSALAAAGELSSAALLGGAVSSMLLGHWYLTAPTMSIAPLGVLTKALSAAAVSRLLLAAAGLSLLSGPLGAMHGMWLALRWLAGIVGPLVCCWMVFRILRYRNTQAATGVLFVAVILVFIGEMTAMLLLHDLHIPL